MKKAPANGRRRFRLFVGAAPPAYRLEVRVAVLSDTHGRPHPDTLARVAAFAPAHILHAGDVGGAHVLVALERLAPVSAVRGNVDRGSALPERRLVRLGSARILLVHAALAGARLRAEVVRAAREARVDAVVCGHSHVPWAGACGGLLVVNPGSVGPRRFRLPVAFATLDVFAEGVVVRHHFLTPPEEA